MKVFLIRHGKKESAFGNPGLTELGIRQAQATGQYLATQHIDKLIAGPLLRTQQTAQEIASFLKLAVETDDRLIERANWDTNISFEEFQKMWRKSSVERDFQPPIGSSSREAGNRMQAVIEGLAKKGDVHSAVLVSHGGIITDFLRNISTDQFLIENCYGTFERLQDCEMPECSITTVEFGENGSYTIKGICSTEHLKALGVF